MKELAPRVPVVFRDSDVKRSPEVRAADRARHLQAAVGDNKPEPYDPYADLYRR